MVAIPEISRLDNKLDRITNEVQTVRRTVAGLAERFPTRTELLELSGGLARVRREIKATDVAVGKLQVDVSRLWMVVSFVAAVASGAAATLVAQLFGGAAG